MRHVNYTLKPATIDNAKPREKTYPLTDGGGLQLEVLPSGSKTWRFKYHLNGKREKVTIGAYPAFTIKQARDRHEELRALVERGQSPAKAKRVLSTEQKLAGARRLSLRSFAQRWVDETLFYRSGGYALVRTFEQALKAVAILPESQRPALRTRLEMVRDCSHNIGFGVGDNMDALLAEHGADD